MCKIRTNSTNSYQFDHFETSRYHLLPDNFLQNIRDHTALCKWTFFTYKIQLQDMESNALVTYIWRFTSGDFFKFMFSKRKSLVSGYFVDIYQTNAKRFKQNRNYHNKREWACHKTCIRYITLELKYPCCNCPKKWILRVSSYNHENVNVAISVLYILWDMYTLLFWDLFCFVYVISS